MTLQHLRSSTANKRPLPGSMSDGQIAINTNTSSPGLFFKDSAGALVKVGPVHVGSTAPNVSPAGGGETGNTVGEQWLDTSGSTYVFKVWDGSAWRSEAGEFVNASGDVMTGALGIIAGSAGSPGLYFSGDTNTGIYSPGADQVAISTNGTGRLFVDSSGSVSVGAATTGLTTRAGLRAADTANSVASSLAGFTICNDNSSALGRTSVIAFNQGDYTAGQQLAGIAGVYSDFSTSVAGALVFSTNNGSGVVGEKARITSDGRLGLGTSSVRGTSLLDARGDISFGSNANYYGLLSYNAATGHIESTSSDGGFKWIRASGPATSMTLDSSGRLGIGTTALIGILSAKAATNGNLHIRDINTITSGTGVALDVLDDAGTTPKDLALRGATISFSRSVGESARIDSSGRLLVGTSSVSNTNVTAAFQGSPASSANAPLVLFKRNTATPGDGDSLGSWAGSDNTDTPCTLITTRRDGGTWSASSKPSRLEFSTTADGASSPTERMRITQAGIVLIGATGLSGSAPDSAGVSIDQDGALRTRIGANGNYQYEFNNATGSLVGYIQVNSGSVTYSTTSDYRLKENLQPLAGAAERIKQLPVYRFNIISDPDTQVDGFVAHEVQAVVPEAISGTKDAVHEDGSINPQGIDQSKLVPLLTAALQEAIAKIETLESKVAALEDV
jgi:hypothetical protein